MAERSILKMVNDEIEIELDYLEKLTPGTEEHTAVTENIARLYKMKHEDETVVNEYLANQNQKKEMAKDRWIKIGIAAAEILIPITFYGVWMKRGFEFEKEGTYTSHTFRNLFGRFKPTK